MSNKLRLLSAFCFLVSALSGVSVAAPDLVSSDSSGLTLEHPEADNGRSYAVLDTSDDGRFVLLADHYPGARAYSIRGPVASSILNEDCHIYRKDRQSGELLTVFSGDSETYDYCNGAKISADGNLVATSPSVPFPQDCIAQNTPDGAEWNCGEFTALVIKNIAADSTREILSNDLSHVFVSPRSETEIGPYNCFSPAFSGTCNIAQRFPGLSIEAFNGPGNVAILQRNAISFESGLTRTLRQLVDIEAGTVEHISLDFLEDHPFASSVAVSEDGKKLAIAATYLARDGVRQSPSSVEIGNIYCDETDPPPLSAWFGSSCTEDPDSADTPESGADSWEDYIANQPSIPVPETDIYIIDRVAGTNTLPAELTSLASMRLETNAWSADGLHISWIEMPDMVTFCAFRPGDNERHCFPDNGCEAEECELRIKRYNLVAQSLQESRTEYDPETTSLCRARDVPNLPITFAACQPQLNRDGSKLLFGRAVMHPFGGDWVPMTAFDPYGLADDQTCITRASAETPGASPELVDCPEPEAPGFSYPRPRGSFGAPVLWYVFDTATENTTLVSTTDSGKLFQTTSMRFSDDGSAIIFNSRDQRLRDYPLSVAGTDENALPEDCFWSPADSGGDLRVATNDNVRPVLDETNDIYEYLKTPVFCQIPTPALERQIYGRDLGSVNLAIINKSRGGSRFKTILSNFSDHAATLNVLELIFSNLPGDAKLKIGRQRFCDIWDTPAASGEKQEVLVRCEIDGLAAGERWEIPWSIESDSKFPVVVKASVSSNENNMNANTATRDRVDIDNGGSSSSFGWFSLLLLSLLRIARSRQH